MKSVKYIALLLLIAVCVYFRWLLPTISVGGDWIYYYPISLRDSFFHFGWVGLSNFGGVDLFIWRFPIDLLKAAIGYLQLDSGYSDKVIIFWPTIIIANIASFILVKKVTRSNIAGFIGALVFNYNTYYFTVNSGFLLYSAGAWSLLSMIFTIKGFEKRKLYLFVLSGIFLTLAGWSDFRVAYITFFINIFYLIYLQVVQFKSKNILLKDFLLFSTTPGIFIVLNIYWIIFFLSTHSLSTNDVVSRTLFGNQFLNITYAFTFFHPFWTGGQTTYFINQQIFFYFWLIPVIVFISLWLHRRNRHILFFGIISLLGIFLTKQVAEPFGGVYYWLFKSFPGFNAFREASKFYFLIAMSYAVLIGALVSYIWKEHLKIFNSKTIKIFSTLIIALVFLWNAKPIVTGELGDIYKNSTLPTEYHKLNKIYSSPDSYFRILWTPYTTSWTKYENTRPVINFAYAISNSWNHIITFKTKPEDPPGKIMGKLLSESYVENLFRLSSIKYIVVPFADKANPNIFNYYGEERVYYTKHLGSLPFLQKTGIGTSKFSVYEIPSFRPHIYTTNERESVHMLLPQLSFKTRFIENDPTKYTVHIEKVTHPFYLNFSEGYNDGWKVRVGKFNWINTFSSNYFVSDKTHIATDALLNSFYIDPKMVCKNNDGCGKAQDGTYTIDLTIYFRPQSYLYLGFVVSGVFLAIIIGYLSYKIFYRR